MVGLVNRNEEVVPGNMICTKHCKITIGEITYTVLWEFKKDSNSIGGPVVMADRNGCDLSSVNVHGANDSTVKHTLPFKVLGTCFSKERQTSLEIAYDYLNNYNKPVFIDLVAEPENKSDPNAIAVYIMYEDDFEKVGYIARELTRFVHPLMKTQSLEYSMKTLDFKLFFYELVIT